jgi:hypothetical protein
MTLSKLALENIRECLESQETSAKPKRDPLFKER